MTVRIRFLRATQVVMLIMGLSSFSQAATFTVTSIGDDTTVDLVTTLREAIILANTTPGVDVINFAIPGLPAQVQTIAIGAIPLPAITETVTIDGYTQNGALANTLAVGSNAALKIELNGTLSAGPGLTLLAGGSTIRGLVINRFSTQGILSTGGTGANTIVGNFIGTDVAGSADLGNGVGVALENVNNTVGTLALADRNLISGNNIAGVSLNATAIGNSVANNVIGTDLTGQLPVANLVGVFLSGGSTNVIGGFLAGQGNLIGQNTNDGIALTVGGTGNSILRNSIVGNGALGIDIGDDGVTPNDAAPDSDVGINDLQNFPVLTATTANISGTRITGTLASTASTSFHVELFANTAADGSGSGEGQTYLGSVEVVTDATGNGSFVFTSPVQQTLGTIISATATAPNGSTSEFSINSAVIAAALQDPTADDDDSSDDEHFIPVPVPPPPPPPFLPPVGGPIDAVAAPVVPAGPVAAAVAPSADVPPAKIDAEASDVLSDEIAVASEDEPAPKKLKKRKVESESGCSTTKTDASMIGFIFGVALILRVMSIRRRNVSR